MNSQQLEQFTKHMEDLAVRINQSDKKEISGLIMDFKNELTKVKQGLENLDKKVSSYIEQDTEDKQKIFEWQKNASPYVEVASKVQNAMTIGGTVTGFLVKTVTFFTLVGGGIWAIIKYLRS
jgi:hypothetical protein